VPETLSYQIDLICPIGADVRHGELITMAEHHEKGPSRFILMQSMQPFPEFLHSNLNEGIPLSRTDIDYIAWHMLDLPTADRAIYAIDIGFVSS